MRYDSKGKVRAYTRMGPNGPIEVGEHERGDGGGTDATRANVSAKLDDLEADWRALDLWHSGLEALEAEDGPLSRAELLRADGEMLNPLQESLNRMAGTIKELARTDHQAALEAQARLDQLDGYARAMQRMFSRMMGSAKSARASPPGAHKFYK